MPRPFRFGGRGLTAAAFFLALHGATRRKWLDRPTAIAYSVPRAIMSRTPKTLR